MTKHGVYALGNAHIGGNPFGPRLYAPGGPTFSTLPTGGATVTWGTVILEYDASTSTGTPFPKDRILTGGTSGAKCRVLSDSGGRVVAQIVPSGTGAFAGQQVASFRPNEVLTDNTNAITGGSNKTATIAVSTILGVTHEHNVQSSNALLANSQISAALLNPLLNTPTPAAANVNVYWDRASKRAKNISLTSLIGLFQAFEMASQSTSRATICRVSGAVLELIDVNGTAWNSGGGTVTGQTSGYGKLTFNSQPNDGDTVTIAAATYTFKTALTPTSGQVLIGASIAATAQNFKDCINHTGTPGTQYAAATPIDPTVNCYTIGITTFLDFQAKTLPSTAATSTSSGGRLTWTSGATLIVATGTQVGAIVVPAGGNLVPYCPMPGFHGLADGWDVLPGGDGVDGEGLTGTTWGIMPAIAPLAYARWGTDLAIYRAESGSMFGITRGGMAYGFLPLSSVPTTWTLGETVLKTNGGAPCSFVIQAVDTPAGGIWVSNLNGSLAASDTLQGQTSGVTATATDNVQGWMKGARWWNSTIAGSDHAAFVTACGSTPTVELLLAFGWEGDLPLPAKSFVFGYTSNAQTSPVNADTHKTATAALWAQFVDDFRTQMASPNCAIDWFVHDQRSQQSQFPIAAIQLRDATRLLVTLRTNVRPVIADGYAFPSTDATHPATTSPQFLFFQPADSLRIGQQCWDAFLQSTFTIPSTGFGAAALLIELSQSQSQVVTLGWLLLERDNVITRLPQNPIAGQYPTYTLLDNRDWSWNFQTMAWEVANASSNLGGLNPAAIGQAGPELAMFPRLNQRVGGGFLFKPSYSGASSDWRERGIPATFDVTPFTRLTATVTGTMVQTVNSSGQSVGVFTADGGTPFGSFTAGEYTEISGGSAFVGAVGGGNNTMTLQPMRIDPTSTPGASLTLLGTGYKNGAHETLTFTQGPIALKGTIEAHWRAAVVGLVELVGRVPKPLAFVVDQCEGNINHASDYAAKMGAVVSWMDGLFAPALKGDQLTPLALALLHDKSPFGTPSLRATMQAQQRLVVTNRGRGATVTTGDLPIEPGTQYPPNVLGADPNATYGIHRTPRGAILQGERADDALNTLLPARDLTVV